MAAHDEVVSRLESVPARLVGRRSVRHAVVALERGDGALRWAGAAGPARPHGTPTQPDTPFYFASVTKLYTATAVLQLWERGRLDLYAPMATYLPQRLVHGVHRLGGVDRSEASAGAPFERPETFAQMQARWNRFGLPRDRTAMMAPSWPVEYGLGIKRLRLPRVFSPLRTPPTLIGHTGASGSWLFHCPEHDLYMAGTVDQTAAAAIPFRLPARLVRSAQR